MLKDQLVLTLQREIRRWFPLAVYALLSGMGHVLGAQELVWASLLAVMANGVLILQDEGGDSLLSGSALIRIAGVIVGYLLFDLAARFLGTTPLADISAAFPFVAALPVPVLCMAVADWAAQRVRPIEESHRVSTGARNAGATRDIAEGVSFIDALCVVCGAVAHFDNMPGDYGASLAAEARRSCVASAMIVGVHLVALFAITVPLNAELKAVVSLVVLASLATITTIRALVFMSRMRRGHLVR